MLRFSNPVTMWRELSPARRHEAILFYIWILPWVLGFLIWQLWPLIGSFYLGFTNYRILNTPQFTGLANVERLIHDDDFWQSLRVTAGYVVGVIPIGNAIALGAALALSQKLRAVNFWRTIYFLPSVVSGVAAAVMWWYVFNPDAGFINNFLAALGIKVPGWLTDPYWALPSVIIIGWWGGIGTQVVIYIAGLKGIPAALYEAAAIDGANRLQTFVRIMLPLITPALATIVIFTFLWSWNDAFNAAIYLNSPQNYTVAIGLRQFLGQYSAEFNLLMAAAAVVMLPTVTLFFFAQRYFIEGITLTGMKG